MQAFLESVTIDYVIVLIASITAIIYVFKRIFKEDRRSPGNDDDKRDGNKPNPIITPPTSPNYTVDQEEEEFELELMEA